MVMKIEQERTGASQLWEKKRSMKGKKSGDSGKKHRSDLSSSCESPE